MNYVFYRREWRNEVFEGPEGMDSRYAVRLWRPGVARILPATVPLNPFAVWWLFHEFHVFANRGYAVLLIYKADTLVHRSCVFPRYFRFPFMAKDDLQIGDTWTAIDHRGRGLATYAIHQIVRLSGSPGRFFWYVTQEDNVASIRVIEKAGFTKVGDGIRTKRFGLSLMGALVIRTGSENLHEIARTLRR